MDNTQLPAEAAAWNPNDRERDATTHAAILVSFFGDVIHKLSTGCNYEAIEFDVRSSIYHFEKLIQIILPTEYATKLHQVEQEKAALKTTGNTLALRLRQLSCSVSVHPEFSNESEWGDYVSGAEKALAEWEEEKEPANKYPIGINEFIHNVAALVYYSQIHTVEGVQPVEYPKHSEAWRAAQKWIWGNCKADENGVYKLMEATPTGAVWVKVSEMFPEPMKHVALKISNQYYGAFYNDEHNMIYSLLTHHYWPTNNYDIIQGIEWLDESPSKESDSVDLLTWIKERDLIRNEDGT
jgi:hypothetical protein